MIYICMRRTLDWQNAAAADAGLVEGFRTKVETWNATFTVPYFEFRQRLKSIAQLNLSRVENARCINEQEAPPNGVVVPVDDDDWFSPELAHRLAAAFTPPTEGVYWTRHILEPERRRRRLKGVLRELITGRIIFATNNYALRNVPERALLAANHEQASRYFQAHPQRRRYLRAALSVHNRSLASQTALAWLRPSITREELIERFDEYRTLYASTRLSRALRWAEPYVALMAELMDALKLR